MARKSKTTAAAAVASEAAPVVKEVSEAIAADVKETGSVPVAAASEAAAPKKKATKKAAAPKSEKTAKAAKDEKATNAAKPAAKSDKAAKSSKTEKPVKSNGKDKLVIEFSGKQLESVDIIERCKAAYKAENPRKRISSIDVYVNIEASKAYYVVNGKGEEGCFIEI